MGLVGGLLLLGGLGMTIMGVIGVVVGLILGDWHNAFFSLGVLGCGLVAGTVATAILE